MGTSLSISRIYGRDVRHFGSLLCSVFKRILKNESLLLVYLVASGIYVAHSDVLGMLCLMRQHRIFYELSVSLVARDGPYWITRLRVGGFPSCLKRVGSS